MHVLIFKYFSYNIFKEKKNHSFKSEVILEKDFFFFTPFSPNLKKDFHN